MTPEEARQLGITHAEAWSEIRLKGLLVAFPNMDLLAPILSALASDEAQRQEWEFCVAHAYGFAFIERISERIAQLVVGHSTTKIQN